MALDTQRFFLLKSDFLSKLFGKSVEKLSNNRCIKEKNNTSQNVVEC